MCSFSKISQFLSKSYSACMKTRTLMNTTWALAFTILAVTIIIRANFTLEEITADPILQGIGGALVVMGWASLACFYMAVVSRD